MKAWQFTNTHEPLVLNDVPEPRPGPGEVTIDIKSAGLCHSDVGLLEDEGWLQTLAKRPITIGHEVAGSIAELGDGVVGWTVGDRVGICPTTEAGPRATFATAGSATRPSHPRSRLCASPMACRSPRLQPERTPG